MKNIVQFKYGFVNLPQNGEKNLELAMMLTSELMQFGYILTEETITHISNSKKEDIINFHNEIIGYLKKQTSSNRSYQPFWKNFPESVMEKSECELWLHQIVHYLSNGTYLPNELAKEKPTAFEQPTYETIVVGDDELFQKIFTDLLSVNNSLTPNDLEIIKWFVESGEKLIYPKEIPFKENLSTLVSMGVDVPLKTPTDVLRVAVAMSGGDTSLPKVPPKMIRTSPWNNRLSENVERENFKFKKFKRKERKQLLSLFEKTNCNPKEAVLNRGRFLRLGEILHPGECKNKFPKTFNMFNKIRNENIKSWYSDLDSEFKISFNNGLTKLSERPGELFRRLDYLIRNANNDEISSIFNLISKVGEKVSNKVLLEVYGHFQKRLKPVTNRTIMIKGSRMNTKLPDLPAIDVEIVQQMQKLVLNIIEKKFSKLESLGKIYIDDELENIPLPTNMRSLNDSLKPIIRGTRIPIGNKNTKVIRAFVHWYDERSDQDLDLSSTFIGLGKKDFLSWNTNHKIENMGCHSGDVRHVVGSCAEYVDIDVKGALKEGFEYVIIDVRNYNGSSFKNVKEGVIGYMEREFPVANETFVPKTISNCTKLESDSNTTIASIIDLKTMEVIHLDIDAHGIPVANSDFEGIMDAISPYLEKPKLSVKHLLEMHGRSRGEIVENKDDADFVYQFNDFSTSYVDILNLIG